MKRLSKPLAGAVAVALSIFAAAYGFQHPPWQAQQEPRQGGAGKLVDAQRVNPAQARQKLAAAKDDSAHVTLLGAPCQALCDVTNCMLEVQGSV